MRHAELALLIIAEGIICATADPLAPARGTRCDTACAGRRSALRVVAKGRTRPFAPAGQVRAGARLADGGSGPGGVPGASNGVIRSRIPFWEGPPHPRAPSGAEAHMLQRGDPKEADTNPWATHIGPLVGRMQEHHKMPPAGLGEARPEFMGVQAGKSTEGRL